VTGNVRNVLSVFLVLVVAPVAYAATALFGLPALLIIRRTRPSHPLLIWYAGALLVGLAVTFGVTGLLGFKGPLLVPIDILALGLVSSLVTAFYLAKFTHLGRRGP